MHESENFDLALDDHLGDEVAERVRSIISAAESAAGALRHEAEQQIQARKRLAEGERQRYLEAARREADELLHQRVTRMSELSDDLIEGAAQLLGEIEGAAELRRSLESTVALLADTAERLVAETREGGPPGTPAAEAGARAAEPEPSPGRAAPERETVAPQPEPETEAVAPEPERTPVQPVPSDTDEPVDAEVVDAEEEPAAARERHLHTTSGEPAGDSAAPKPAAAADDDALAARLVALQMAVAGSSRGEVEQHLRTQFRLGDTTAILNDVFGSDVPGVAR